MHRIALSDNAGKAKLTVTEKGNTGSASLFATDSGEGEVDEVVPEREFKLLKIDLEGSELRALRGAARRGKTPQNEANSECPV